VFPADSRLPIALFVSLAALMLLLSGCPQPTPTPAPTPTPTRTPSGGLCSKGGYKTEKAGGLVSLTAESMELLAANGYDLGEITGLKCLEHLSLADTPVPDISALEELENLKSLDLSYTAVLDISSLKELGSLERLGLIGTGVERISALRGLESLKTINLRDTPVSKVESYLKDLPQLEYVDLRGTNVKLLECKSLQQELPNTNIICPESEDVKNCGYDRKDFSNEFEDCSRAKLFSREREVVYLYEILGENVEREGYCDIRFGILSHPDSSMVGKESVCAYDFSKEFESIAGMRVVDCEYGCFEGECVTKPLGYIRIGGGLDHESDCGSLECFEEKFDDCSPAKLTSHLDDTLVHYYEIIGPKDGLCEVESKYLVAPNPEWIGFEMNCLYDNSDDFSDAIKDLDRCEGALYDLIKGG